MGKSGKKRSKEEASPNFASDHPDKGHKMAANTPPAGIPTPPPAIYGTPAASGPVMPPHLQYLTQQTPTQYGYMNAPVSPQNGKQTHNTSQMDSEMYTTILNKLNNIECTQNKCNQNFQN
ncbi:hypothetical protein DPMN_013484 [Dreissena polymorpha]|uniref:Uncharacterized protein n=1 Tax=Dreissena polymorpha TaxID=45954 RepID=A0A9D4N5J2_DREPO|nr:hypothetical protein DPMN_013484 [Dreissena polymorpha]